MGEKKIINESAKHIKKVRMKLPRAFAVKTTGNFISKGSKFNSRKEEFVIGDDIYYEDSTSAAQHVNIQNSAPAASLHRNASSNAVMDDPPNSLQDGKNASRHNAMIFEALSTLKDTNGSDIGAILNFIEVRWRT
ncbi:hypothetical protein FEM48_Zijuj05G0138400 [Ziziphus jujuba var. spinosa]|uniref:Uncharacterized protein n=1 Tax=Ziziphus jujuba var. spinosa TaxID=714518 RepID=A0A978VF72_ZIZJJ|nr:hypothetical protein FEM48_Zijuj05G0138400 [Ziziphus jujuba var. spinosa]